MESEFFVSCDERLDMEPDLNFKRFKNCAMASNKIPDQQLLVEAAACGNYEDILSCLKAGVPVDAKQYIYSSKNYNTPLQLAAEKGFSRCVDLLISHGANVNAVNKCGETALHMTAEKGYYSCLKSLLKGGAKCLPKRVCINSYELKFKLAPFRQTKVIFVCDSTPLHLAAAHNHIDCVVELMNYGADYNAVDLKGHTSLYIAAQRGFGECVLAQLECASGRAILSLPSLDTFDIPLHFAVSKKLFQCVKELLKFGSDVNHLNNKGLSPLHLAVMPGLFVPFDILKMLVLDSYTLDINQKDGDGKTPLHYVCLEEECVQRRVEMAKFLLAYGANVNLTNNKGLSVFSYLMKGPVDIEIFQYMLRSILHLPAFDAPSWVIEYLSEDNSNIAQENLSDRQNIPLSEEVHDAGLGMNCPSLLENCTAKALELLGEFYAQPQNTGITRSYASGECFETLLLRSQSLIRHSGNVPQEISHLVKKKILNPYSCFADNPRTLQHYCRFNIRKSLRFRSLKYIHELPLPGKLKSYLLLEYGN